MKQAIMQPYFLPYIGYWQLVSAVDSFVVYDNIEYTKKGWFNRNRILVGGHDQMFTIPIKKDSDFLDVVERRLSDDAPKEIARILRVVEANYKKAPHFAEAFPIIKACFEYQSQNLFDYIFNSLKTVAAYLELPDNFKVSSTVDTDHRDIKGQEKVLAICKAQGATQYINSIGGQELYDKTIFKNEGIELNFIKASPIEYKQFENEFVPWLSILDVMMFNDVPTIKKFLDEYSLI